MKNIKTYIAWLVASVAVSTGLCACQDDFDAPSQNAPVATLEPNTTIEEFKKAFWQDAANYADTVGTKEDGSHYIIHGTVVSSDEAGNVYKYLVIQDETGAVNISVNSYNLYLNYRRGQEIVLDCTGMYVGKYAGLFQFGFPSYYENGSTWQVGFMAPEFFTRHVELNGLPNLADIDTITVDGFAELSTTTEGLQKWQSQLVRFNNVSFANGGTADFSVYHTSVSADQNQNLIDAAGNTIVVRTSGYANFATQRLPSGSGDVVGLLGYYETLSGSTTWQLALIDEEGCMNFGNPTIAPGAENNPWTVDEAIDVIANGKTKTGWVTGYIVGAVAPEVSEVKTNEDVEWTANPILDNTLVIGQTADTRDIAHALVVELPNGTPLHKLGNLASHPENYGKQIWIRGNLAMVMDTYGVAGNNGATSNWRIDGVEGGGSESGSVTDGNGTQATPYSANQVINGTASGTSWVRGYIVGSSNGMTASEYTHGTDNASETNIFIANNPDETDYKKCVPVQLPVGAVRTALNLKANPGNYGKIVTVNGSIEKYFGQPGVKAVTEYELEGADTPTPPSAEGSGTESDPYSVATVIGFNPTSTTEGTHNGVWVKGYIVGWADLSTTYVIDATTARFNSNATLATNLLLGPSASCTDVTQCIGVQLPSGSVRTALNLVDNPGNLGKEALLKGDILKYSGVPGLKNTSDYRIEGGSTTPEPPSTGDVVTSIDQNFDASTNIPAGWTQAQVAGNKAWYIATYQSNNYASMTGYKGTAPFDQWLLTPGIDMSKVADKTLSFRTQVNGYGSTTSALEVYVLTTNDVTTASKTKLPAKLATAPASGYSEWMETGAIDLSAYSGVIYIGFRYTAQSDANYATWCVDDVKVNAAGGTPEPENPDEPDTPSSEYKGDFNSFNNGTAKSSYGTYTNATGWKAENCAILGGTDKATGSNPYFPFIGGAGTLAPTLNGKVGASGVLTSPKLTGGIGTLTFKYGFAFAESKCKFTVNIKDASGNVVKTDTVTLDTITQSTPYKYTLAVNLSGDFYIEVMNDCYSAVTSNKDRVSIWDLTWTSL